MKYHIIRANGECSICGPTKTWVRKGKIRCINSSEREKRRKSASSRRRDKVKAGIDRCQLCGFVAYDSCQLSIDHINGNHYDNSAENLWVLCHNCHSLKTKLNEDWLPGRDHSAILVYLPSRGILQFDLSKSLIPVLISKGLPLVDTPCR